MFKKLLLLCSVVLILTSVGYAKEVGGINMPDTLAAGTDTLILNGAGDDPASFQMYLLCCAIVLGAAMIALAVSRREKK